MRIFLCHASEQAEMAESIAVALSGEGHVVFLDRAALPSGESYNDRIREAIAESDLFIFLVSPESVERGRYSLTELEFAKEKWTHPAGHVLPVVVKPTPLDSVPVYLRAVTFLEPPGNVPAAVASAVARLAPSSRRLVRWAAAVVVVLLCAGVLGWWGVKRRATAREVSGLLESGQVQRQSGRYAAAWDLYARADAVSPGDAGVVRAQERLAMDWLDNIQVTVGQSTFSSIVEKVEPVLARCAGSNEAVRAADCRAHIGWGDFLRSREGAGGLDPAEQYRRALERDPQNVYAHAMLAFDILRSGGPLERARRHVDQALSSGRERAYVRHLQIAGLLWRRSSEADEEIVRVANAMRIGKEAMPGGRTARSDTWRIWDVYFHRLISGRDLEAFHAAVPPAEHLATFLWLFPEPEIPDGKRNQSLFMRASLQERAGERAEALVSFRALRDTLARDGGLKSGGPLVERTLAALKRLSATP